MENIVSAVCAFVKGFQAIQWDFAIAVTWPKSFDSDQYSISCICKIQMSKVLINFSFSARTPKNNGTNLIVLVYTTQVNSTFRARWSASSEVISKVLFTSEQPKKNKMTFVGTLSQIKLLFWPLVIQLVWYILKQLFTSVSVKVVDIYIAVSLLGKYPPLFTST